jgi:type 1 fimbria pilin
MNQISHMKPEQQKSNELPRNLIFAASTALFICMFLLFQNSQPVGNNYDHLGLFAIYIIVPSVITQLIITLLQKRVNYRILLRINIIFETVLLFWFAGEILNFELYNGDNPIYIFAWVMLYKNELYFTMMGGVLSLIYLSVLERIEAFRENATPMSSVYMWLTNNIAYAAGLSLIVLLISQYISVGIGHIILGLFVGIAGIITFSNEKEKIPNLNAFSCEHEHCSCNSHPKHQLQTELPKSKKFILTFTIFILSFLIGNLWPTSYVRYYPVDGDPNMTMWWAINQRQALAEGILALLIFISLVVIFQKQLFKFYSKISANNSNESILALCVGGLLTLLWLLFNTGTNLLFIRYSTLLMPWIVILIALWIIGTTIQGKNYHPGFLGTNILLFGFGVWGGLSIGVEPEDVLTSLIVSILVASVFILIIIQYLVLQPKLRSLIENTVNVEKSENSESFEAKIEDKTEQNSKNKIKDSIKAKQNESPAKKTAISTKKKQISAGLLILLCLVPIGFVSYGAAAPSNFQILANVDNSCIFYLADSTTRIDKDFKPNLGLNTYSKTDNVIKIEAAKNEHESFQIVMLPINQKHQSIYDIQFSGFTHSTDGSKINNSNYEKYIVEYIDALSEVVPDQLVDFHSFSTADGKNHPLWFTFYVPTNATAGDYTGSLTFTLDNKTDPDNWYNSVKVEFKIDLKVFNFTLPQTPTLKSNFGYRYEPFDEMMEHFQTHRMMRWAFFHLPKVNISTDGSIASINFEEMREEIEEFYGYGTHTLGFHLTQSQIFNQSTFTVSGVDYTPSSYKSATTYDKTFTEYISLLEAELKSHSYIDDFGQTITWYDDAYMNSEDEIQARAQKEIDRVTGEHTWLKNTVNMTLPIMQTIMGSEVLPQILANIDIICVHTMGFEPEYITNWINAGKEVWIYTTRGPRMPSPSISTSGMATQVRALGWQCWVQNYSQYLIWDIATPKNARSGYGYQGWNGGTMLYPTADGYDLSTRMELIREGFEDHDYFFLLNRKITQLKSTSPTSAKIAKGEVLLGKVDLLIVDETPIMDYREFNALRHEIGTYLEV